MADISAHKLGTVNFFMVVLGADQDPDRAERILAAAVLTINDKVTSLYRGQQAPARTSELEKGNYQ